jgi:hypothetical protein
MRDDELMAIGAGSLGALLLGLALVPLGSLTPPASFAFAFMALVIVVAEWGGARAAVSTALVSALCLDFFLTPPYLRLEIAAKEDLVPFCGLGLCGLLVAGLAHRRSRLPCVVLALLGAGLARTARAEEATPAAKPVTLTGYVETFYSWNFDRPANDVTAYRGFDNRHDTFTLSNVALAATWKQGPVTGRFAFQVGHTPETYYLAEPSSAPAGGTGASGKDVWKYVQQANLGWRAPVARGLDVEMGVFLSPIGPEGIAVKDDWNWSRSNLFYGLPFYHTGLRATYPLSARWAVTGAVYNGWNSVTDNNDAKSLSLQALYTTPTLTASALYFGGNERPKGAPEGEPWRNLFDGYVTAALTPRVSVQFQADGGFENNAFGRSDWFATALAARVQATRWLAVAGRGDVFWENVAQGSAGAAAPIFWPVDRVSSLTLTLDARPAERFSIRLEGRHDSGSGPLYFGRDGRPDQDRQDTVTLGLTAWF